MIGELAMLAGMLIGTFVFVSVGVSIVSRLIERSYRRREEHFRREEAAYRERREDELRRDEAEFWRELRDSTDAKLRD